jgi:hypothetical protein
MVGKIQREKCICSQTLILSLSKIPASTEFPSPPISYCQKVVEIFLKNLTTETKEETLAFAMVAKAEIVISFVTVKMISFFLIFQILTFLTVTFRPGLCMFVLNFIF